MQMRESRYLDHHDCEIKVLELQLGFLERRMCKSSLWCICRKQVLGNDRGEGKKGMRRKVL